MADETDASVDWVSPEGTEDDVVRKAVTILAVAFVAFYLLTEPESSADAVRGALGGLHDGAEALVTFFRSLG